MLTMKILLPDQNYEPRLGSDTKNATYKLIFSLDNVSVHLTRPIVNIGVSWYKSYSELGWMGEEISSSWSEGQLLDDSSIVHFFIKGQINKKYKIYKNIYKYI